MLLCVFPHCRNRPSGSEAKASKASKRTSEKKVKVKSASREHWTLDQNDQTKKRKWWLVNTSSGNICATTRKHLQLNATFLWDIAHCRESSQTFCSPFKKVLWEFFNQKLNGRKCTTCVCVMFGISLISCPWNTHERKKYTVLRLLFFLRCVRNQVQFDVTFQRNGQPFNIYFFSSLILVSCVDMYLRLSCDNLLWTSSVR